MKIIISVDTEADDQWKRESTLSIDNVFMLDRFQNLCERYNMPPTYLLTHEVATSEKATQQFKIWQDRGAEIGAHLHPWTTPPLDERDADENPFPSELSDEELGEKLSNLTRAVGKVCGHSPTSYRAGRWGFDARQAEFLEELGYTVDLSITPGLSWKKLKGRGGAAGGPDFSKEQIEPRLLNDKVLEVPMTILRTGFLRRLKWLRVFENTTVMQLKSVIKTALRRGLPTAVFMIHSSELAVGKSPYVKTPDALEHVYECLEGLFKVCEKEGVRGITASAFAKEYKTV